MKGDMQSVLTSIFEDVIEDIIFGPMKETSIRQTHIHIKRIGNSSFMLFKNETVIIECHLSLLKEDMK